MSGWQNVKYNEVGDCIRGVSYDPTDLRPAPGSDSVTLLRSNNIRGGRLNFDDVQYVDFRAVRPEQRLQPLDIVLCMSNGNRALVGKSGQFIDQHDGLIYTVGAFCSIFRPSKNYDEGFVRHLFGSQSYQRHLDVILAGSAINNLKGSDISAMNGFLPEDKSEQTKIAEILSTVDRAIEQTEALIAKQQRIKTGLMWDLLTHGIDEHGNLRSEQTHEFKDSVLGRIPADWTVDTLNRCVRADAPICYGILMPGQGYDNGVPVIKVRDIVGGRVLQEDLLLTDPRIDRQYSRSRLCAGDLLVTIRGTTGRIARVPSELEGANITQDTARVRLAARCSPRFFYFLLQSTTVQAQISLHTIGQAVKGINIGDVKRLQVATPLRDEQDHIADRLEAIDTTLFGAQSELGKLRSLKSSLMQDLLSGKRRVTALLAQPEVAGV